MVVLGVGSSGSFATSGALKHRHDGKHDLDITHHRSGRNDTLNEQLSKQSPDNSLYGWMTGSLCFMVLTVTMSSSMFSTAMVLTAKEFGVSPQYMLLGLSLYTMGIACGALIFGRLAKLYGHHRLLLAAMATFVLSHMVVGFATDLPTVFLGRYLAGFSGGAPVVIAPIVAFQFESIERTISIAAYATALSSGPLLGVICGEFALLIPSSTWRWTVWIAASAGVFSTCLALVAPTGTQKPANRATRVAQNQSSHSLTRSLVIVVCASLIYGLLHMTLLVYPMSFEIDRAFPFGISSLPFLTVLAGLIIGCGSLVRKAKQLRSDMITKSETSCMERTLGSMSFGCCTLVLGLFMFAWTSFRDLNPWPQISSGLFIGYGIITVLAPALIYLNDASPTISLSIPSYIFMQSTVASVSPLLVIPLYKKLGVQWASGLLATIYLLVALVLLFVYRRMRESN